MSEIVSPAAAASSKVKYRAYFVAGRLDDTHSSVQEPSSLDSPNIDPRVVVHPLTVGAAFVGPYLNGCPVVRPGLVAHLVLGGAGGDRGPRDGNTW